MTLAVSFTAGAQDNPDFSGKWATVDAEPAAGNAGTGPGGGGRGFQPGFGPEFTAKQDAKTLTITRGGQSSPLTYNLDGSESKNTMTMRDGQQREQISTAKWEGNMLVIVTQLNVRGQTFEQRRVLSLEDGNLVIDQTNPGRNGGTVKVAYKKG